MSNIWGPGHNEEKRGEVKSQTTARKSLQEELNEVQEHIENLSIEYTAPENKDRSLITPEDMKAAKTKLLLQREDIRSKIKKQQEEADSWLELSEQTFNFCTYARYHLAKGDLNKKRAVFTGFGSNLTLKDKKLNIQAYKPYLIVRDTLKKIRTEQERLELKKMPVNKRKEAAFAASRLTWLPG